MGLKDLLFEKEEPKQQPAVKSTPIASTSEPSIVRGGRRGSSSISEDDNSIGENPRITEKLIGILGEANLEGPDYLEYMEAVNSMENDVPDEEKRFQLAYVSFKAMKVPVEKLTSAGDHYVKILASEKTKFVNLQNDRLGSVNQDAKKIKELNDAIKKAEAQIIQYQSELTTLEEKSSKTKADVERKVAEFDISYEHIVENIKDNVEKIKKYLKG